VGWFWDIVEDVIDWIEKHIFRPFKEWVVRMIEEIQVNLRNFMHTLKETLAEWLQNDWFFFFFVIGIIDAIIFLPQLAEWFSHTELWLTVSAFASKVFDETVKLIDINKYIDLKFLDTILKTFNAEYRDVRSAMANSVAGLAADLGHGTGFLNGLMESARGVYAGSAAILGLPQEMAEIQWYNETSAFTKKVNDRFYHYAKDPGAVYYDFFTEVLLPRATEYGKLQQEQLDQIRENFDRLTEFEGGLALVMKSVDDFIALMPAEIKFQFNSRWDDIRPIIQDLVDTLVTDVMPLFESTVRAMEEREAAQRLINEEVESKINDAVEIYSRYEILDEGERTISRIGFSNIVTGGEASQALLPAPDAAYWQARLDALTDGFFGSQLVSPALVLETAAASWRVPDTKGAIPSPFVGNY